MDYEGRYIEQTEDFLDKAIGCDTVCADLGNIKTHKKGYIKADYDWLIAHLPGLDYVLGRMLNYIFSNGLTTGSDPDDETKLDPWLFETKNASGTTNYMVLRNVIGRAMAYGEWGLRLYQGNLYGIPKGSYGVIYETENGIDRIHAYFIRKDLKPIDKDFKLDFEELVNYEDVQEFFEARSLIFLGMDEFVNIRVGAEGIHGVSPLTKDRERVELLISIYKRLNYDIDYDGPGRIIVRPRDGYISGDDNDISTGQVLSSGDARQRNTEAKAEIKRIGKEIKDSNSDSVILLSNAFSDKIEHLPRVTKATEFFGWLDNELVIIAQLFGMSPTLLEVGKLHGNVSVEKIIDNAMLNTIIPIRESFAVQFSELIASYLKVGKVYFDKYDMEQVRDENEIRQKVASVIKDLATASKALEGDDKNVNALINEFTEVLRTSLYDDNGALRAL